MPDMELIDRKTLKKAMSKVHIAADDLYGLGVMKGLNFAFEVVENATTIDAVPVVRCKDCVKSRPLNRRDRLENQYVDGCVWCMEHSNGVYEDDFCSYGERKEQ